jgi:hypothetical protein
MGCHGARTIRLVSQRTNRAIRGIRGHDRRAVCQREHNSQWHLLFSDRRSNDSAVAGSSWHRRHRPDWVVRCRETCTLVDHLWRCPSVGELSDAECLESVRAQIKGLDHACSEVQRDPGQIRRLLLTGSSQEPWMSSVESFLELAHTYAAIGITDIVLHAPQPVSHLRYDPKVLEKILSQL